MVLETTKINGQEVANIARAHVVGTTAGFGIGGIVRAILASAIVQALMLRHKRAVKRLRRYRRARAKVFG